MNKPDKKTVCHSEERETGTVEWLVLKLVSKKHGTPTGTLRYWKSQNDVTSFVIDDMAMLDEEDASHLLEAHKTGILNDETFKNIIEGEGAGSEVSLSESGDESFLLTTLKLHQPLFHIIIKELGALINDENRREIFLAVSHGEPILQVAKKHGMSYAKVQKIYSDTLGKLSENTERIVSKYGETIKRLRWKFNVDNPMNIPLTHIFNLRAYDALASSEGIKTLYELLEFTSKWGWRRLKNIDGVDRVSYQHIIETLYNEGIITIDADREIKLIPEIDAILL